MRRALPLRSRVTAALEDLLYRVIRLVTRPSRTLRRRLEHSPATGRLVELLGDVVAVEGLRFSVGSPAISRAAKAPFVFGSYESAERRLLRRHLDPSLPVMELGASVGVVSCLVNRRLDDPGAHVVVEANPALLPVLTSNAKRNECTFRIVHAALAYGVREVRFATADNFTASRALDAVAVGAGEGASAVTVPAITLRELLADAKRTRCTLICDVEGAEWAMVEQDADTLRRHVSMLVIELHPEPRSGREIDVLRDRITALGFREVDRLGETFVFSRRD